MRFIVVGALCRDIIVIGNEIYRSFGGPHFYCANALESLGAEVTSVITCSAADAASTLPIRSQETFFVPCEGTIQFINYYKSSQSTSCRQTVVDCPNTIQFPNLELVEIDSADCIVLAPLLPGNIPVSLIVELSKRYRSRIALAGQGFMRMVEGSKVINRRYLDIRGVLNNLDFLFLNRREAQVASGHRDLSGMMRFLRPLRDTTVVVTDGHRGSWLLKSGRDYKVPACRATKVVDTTGAGETFMAAFLFARQNSLGDIDAAEFASAAAAISIEAHGPLHASVSAVQVRNETMKRRGHDSQLATV